MSLPKSACGKVDNMDEKDLPISDIDDFEAEVEAVCQNQELMKFLEERSRSREEKTYSLAEVEKKLGLA